MQAISIHCIISNYIPIILFSPLYEAHLMSVYTSSERCFQWCPLFSNFCLKARTPWGRLGHQQHRNWVGEKWGQMRQPQFFTRQLFPFHIFNIYWLIDSFIYNSSIYSIDLSSAASNWVCENGANEAATICSNWKKSFILHW